MSPSQNSVQALLQSLPARWRKAIYVLIAVLGFAVGLLQAADVSEIGPFTMTQVLQFYAFVSPLAGVVAVANVKKPPVDSAALGSYAGAGDYDVSTFEPVGAAEEVYGEMGEQQQEEPWVTS